MCGGRVLGLAEGLTASKVKNFLIIVSIIHIVSTVICFRFDSTGVVVLSYNHKKCFIDGTEFLIGWSLTKFLTPYKSIYLEEK